MQVPASRKPGRAALGKDGVSANKKRESANHKLCRTTGSGAWAVRVKARERKDKILLSTVSFETEKPSPVLGRSNKFGTSALACPGSSCNKSNSIVQQTTIIMQNNTLIKQDQARVHCRSTSKTTLHITLPSLIII
eukprot:scaffold7272_cov124-Skeletonema_dohrnii-CCMP3373.AAC.11